MNDDDNFPWWKDAIYRDSLITCVVLVGGLILLVKLFQ